MSHNAKELPDVSELETRFIYDDEQGVLISKKTNKEIRRKDASGYNIVTIDGKIRRVNRVIWKMKTGTDPDGIVDYVDGNFENNAWSNLRLVTEKEFYARKKAKDIDNGLDNNNYGVSYYKRSKTWRVQLRINGETQSKYGFSTEQEAINYSKSLIDNAMYALDNKDKLDKERQEREDIINDLFE